MPRPKFLSAGWRTALFLTALLAFLGRPASAQDKDSVLQFQLAEQLKQSAALWNKGDLEGFMVDYFQSPELTFTSGGRILKGYDALRERYEKRYGQTRESMGQLSFSDIEVWRLAPGRALVMGRWKVDKMEGGAPSSEDGVFSLVMVEVDGRWKIFHDHTSLSADK